MHKKQCKTRAAQIGKIRSPEEALKAIFARSKDKKISLASFGNFGELDPKVKSKIIDILENKE